MSYSCRGLPLSSSCHTAAEDFRLVRHVIQLQRTFLSSPCHTATELFHLARHAIQLQSYFTWLAMPYNYSDISLGSPCHTATELFHLARHAIQLQSYFTWFAMPYSYSQLHSYTPSAYGRSQNPGTLLFKFSCQPVLTVPQLLQ